MSLPKYSQKYGDSYCNRAGKDRCRQVYIHCRKIGNYAETHPKAVEIVLGLGTFLAGVFTGKKVEEHTQEPAPQEKKEPINFDEVE